MVKALLRAKASRRQERDVETSMGKGADV